MTGRNQQPRTPLMVDAALVEITRLLSRAREVSDLLDVECHQCDGNGSYWSSEVDETVPCEVCDGEGLDSRLRGRVNDAYVESMRRLRVHRETHDIDEPNH